MMSGGPIRKFKEGWAIALFKGRRAHWFARFQMSGAAASLCGQVVAFLPSLRGPGSFARCSNCERELKKWLELSK